MFNPILFVIFKGEMSIIVSLSIIVVLKISFLFNICFGLKLNSLSRSSEVLSREVSIWSVISSILSIFFFVLVNCFGLALITSFTKWTLSSGFDHHFRRSRGWRGTCFIKVTWSLLFLLKPVKLWSILVLFLLIVLYFLTNFLAAICALLLDETSFMFVSLLQSTVSASAISFILNGRGALFFLNFLYLLTNF